MSLNKDAQTRLWILAQPIISSDENFEMLISKMYLVCEVFINQIGDDLDDKEEETLKFIIDIKTDLIKHRKQEILRTQDNVNSFKIDIHNTLSKIITMIEPDIMQDIPIEEL